MADGRLWMALKLDGAEDGWLLIERGEGETGRLDGCSTAKAELVERRGGQETEG